MNVKLTTGKVKFSQNATIDLVVPPVYFDMTISQILGDNSLLEYSISIYDMAPNTTYKFFYKQDGVEGDTNYLDSFTTNVSGNISLTGTFSPASQEESFVVAMVPSISAVSSSSKSPNGPQLKRVYVNVLNPIMSGAGGRSVFFHDSDTYSTFKLKSFTAPWVEEIRDVYGSLISSTSHQGEATYEHISCTYNFKFRGTGFSPNTNFRSSLQFLDDNGDPVSETFSPSQTDTHFKLGVPGATAKMGKSSSTGTLAVNYSKTILANSLEEYGGIEVNVQEYTNQGQPISGASDSFALNSAMSCTAQSDITVYINVGEPPQEYIFLR